MAKSNEYLKKEPDGQVDPVGFWYNRKKTIEGPEMDPKDKSDLEKRGAKNILDGSALDREGSYSIFNRYALFFYNNINRSGLQKENEPFFDSSDRIKDDFLKRVLEKPTVKNLIEWSKGQNAVEYSWEDFLWAKNYGYVPNNYMVTLRRFRAPVDDNIFDPEITQAPDISRMITWVDQVDNKWENVGLKWTHGFEWEEKKGALSSQQDSQRGYGNEGQGKGLMGMVAKLTDTSAATAARTQNENTNSINPYDQSSGLIYGPVDIIDSMKMRKPGIKFEQSINLIFRYKIRSIDGINPRIAFIDLLANVMTMTMNKTKFWGGENHLYGTNRKILKPFGDPEKIRKGDYFGYVNSLVDGKNENSFLGRFNNLGGNPLDVLKNVAKNGMSLMSGGFLDKIGRPQIMQFAALLTGENTGEWHVTVGNPANPIIAVGNMILESTEIEFDGMLSADDFPTELKVTCTLKPARPRSFDEILGMFTPNGPVYTRSIRKVNYAGNSQKGKVISSTKTKTPSGSKNTTSFKDVQFLDRDIIEKRFPNHASKMI